jgi:hypothetical protein
MHFQIEGCTEPLRRGDEGTEERHLGSGGELLVDWGRAQQPSVDTSTSLDWTRLVGRTLLLVGSPRRDGPC